MNKDNKNQTAKQNHQSLTIEKEIQEQEEAKRLAEIEFFKANEE